MVCLRLQKRLAASVLKCGKNRLWLDPNESNEISLANSRMSIRKLVKDGLIMKKNITIHSRSRARRHLESKRLGRHTGAGKRKGTRESRMPQKVLWIRRQRVLRRLLRKYRAAKKLISINITNSIWLQKVTNSKTRKYLLRLFISPNKRKLNPTN